MSDDQPSTIEIERECPPSSKKNPMKDKHRYRMTVNLGKVKGNDLSQFAGKVENLTKRIQEAVEQTWKENGFDINWKYLSPCYYNDCDKDDWHTEIEIETRFSATNIQKQEDTEQKLKKLEEASREGIKKASECLLKTLK